MDTIVLDFGNNQSKMTVLSSISSKSVPIDPRSYQRGLGGRFRVKAACLFMGHRLFVQADPIDPTGIELRLTFHLSHFNDYGDVCTWLLELFGRNGDLAFTGQIRRIDMCCDLALPFDQLAETLSKPGIQLSRYFSGQNRLREYIYGARPDQVVFYEKYVPFSQLDYIGNLQNIDSIASVLAVRIERRIYGKKVPVKQFLDLWRLRDYNPFSNLGFNSVDTFQLHSLSERKKKVLYAYQHRVRLIGTIAARQEFSKNGNFQRMIGQYMTKSDFDLGHCWINRIEKFFGLRSDVIAPIQGQEDSNYADFH